MNRLAITITSVLMSLPAFAAVSGTVINGTTGKPQGGILVSLLRMGPKGPEPWGTTTADAQGKFKLDVGIEGPTLVRAKVDGVTYNHVLAPGIPSEGITLDVYNASRKPEGAKISKHMILFEPTGGQLVVNEAYVISNTGKTAWDDPEDGTLHFFLPPTLQGPAQISATPPGGQPLQQHAEKTSQANIFRINFAMRPGDSRVDLNYTLPYKEGAPFSGKIVSGDENTYLIVPEGVTMAGANLNDMGTEPRTKAHIYGLKGTDYQIQLTGAVSPRNTDADTSEAGDNSGQPPVQQIMPRVYDQVKLILPLALGILALGFVLLYRMPQKDTNASARR
ncbi:MAG: hypothetical protein JO336_01615 [Acidobacteriia bacterium]|nr:hypothetical protein [Terriglobia bacterium]MBV8902699.1 hypothetical protein [Terriglobia bacterium]